MASSCHTSGALELTLQMTRATRSSAISVDDIPSRSRRTSSVWRPRAGPACVTRPGVRDSRGTHLVAEGTAAEESAAKAEMIVALGALVEKLEFRSIDD